MISVSKEELDQAMELAGKVFGVAVVGAIMIVLLLTFWSLFNNPAAALRRERSRIQEEIYEIGLAREVRGLRLKLHGLEEAEHKVGPERCRCGAR